MISFDKLVAKTRGPNWTPPNTLLALDPGETTGWAVFLDGRLTSSGEIKYESENQVLLDIYELMKADRNDYVVAEDYRIYAHKKDSHTWDALFTPKLLGAIQLICALEETPLILQMASTGKGFCKDHKLKIWGMYQEGQRHARDAIRHGAHALLFSEELGERTLRER